MKIEDQDIIMIDDLERRSADPAKASKLLTAGYIILAGVFVVIVWRRYIRQ